MRFRSRIVTQLGTIGTALAVALLGACSSDDAPDARVATHFPDAAPPPIDAAPPALGGTVSIQDVQVLGVAAAGHGGNITISFTPAITDTTAAQLTEQHAGTFGLPPCYAVRYDTMGKAPPAVSDEGPVTFTVTPATVTIPPCTRVGGAYRCIGATGTAGAILPSAMSAMVSTFTVGTATVQPTAADLGRYLAFGTTAIPIVGFSAGLLGLQTTAGPLTVPATGPWQTVAGAGPVAFTAAPDGSGIGAPPAFFNDGDSVKFDKAASAHFPVATATLPVTTAWTLDGASTTALANKLLTATAAVELGCDTSSSTNDGTCGTLTTALKGTIVAIDSSDTMPTAQNPFPAPTRHSANITCTQLDNVALFASIPTALFDVVKAAQPKVLRISIFRAGLSVAGAINYVVGRGFVTFEQVP